MSADDIARDLLSRNNCSLTSALLHACSMIDNARARVEDFRPNGSMSPADVDLLWKDLHPFKAAPDDAS